jgi:primosomal protein N' (replication factor Y)
MPSNTHTFIDVVFPQNINRLTYILPDSLKGQCRTGSIVEAPIRGKVQYGMVVRTYSDRPEIGRRKKLIEIKNTVSNFNFNRSLVDLLKWVSDYYMSTEGLALKNLLFSDAFYIPRRRAAIKLQTVESPHMSLPDKKHLFKKIDNCIKEESFQTILFHSMSLASECALIMNIVDSFNNIIILVPERHDISYFVPFLEGHANGRYCTLHGGMSKSAKSEAFRGINSGKYNIVIGTMQTVFSPMSKPSIIIVFKEHSVFYKHEETPAYNVRDVAIKRGSLENIPVLLTSLAPSFESYFNHIKGKYLLIEDETPENRPDIKVMNAAGSNTILTSPLIKRMKEAIQNNNDVLLILNRKGHSILQCNECGHIDVCVHCEVPMVLHSEKVLRCHYCSHEIEAPDMCAKCKSVDLVSIGSGTEKVYNLLKDEFNSCVQLIDREHVSENTIYKDESKIIIGTDLAFRKINPFSKFGLTAILNADISTHKPDFRIYEKLFNDIIYLSQYNEDNSDMIIQTYDWRNQYFSFVKKYDYKGFFNSEIKKREMFNYPPYSKIASLSVKKSSFNNSYSDIKDKNIEFLGPLYKKIGKKERMEFLIKYKSNIAVQGYILKLLNGIVKDKRDLKIDIDPLVFT